MSGTLFEDEGASAAASLPVEFPPAVHEPRVEYLTGMLGTWTFGGRKRTKQEDDAMRQVARDTLAAADQHRPKEEP